MRNKYGMRTENAWRLMSKLKWFSVLCNTIEKILQLTCFVVNWKVASKFAGSTRIDTNCTICTTLKRTYLKVFSRFPTCNYLEQFFHDVVMRV